MIFEKFSAAFFCLRVPATKVMCLFRILTKKKRIRHIVKNNNKKCTTSRIRELESLFFSEDVSVAELVVGVPSTYCVS